MAIGYVPPAGGVSEEDVDAAIATAIASRQLSDADLTELAALSTTAYGRGLLELANAAAGRTALDAAQSSHAHVGLVGAGPLAAVTGRWAPAGLHNAGASTTTRAIGADESYGVPIFLHSSMSFDAIGFNVSTAASAGAVARLALYRPSASYLPGALEVDAGTVAIDSTGQKTATISKTLSGLFWITLTPSASVTVTAHTGTATALIVGGTTPHGYGVNTVMRSVSAAGAAPDPWGAVDTYYRGGDGVHTPALGLRFA